MRESRAASRSSCAANRGITAGSSRAAVPIVSAAAWIEAAGVFSSCDAFAHEVPPDGFEPARLRDVAHDQQHGAVVAHGRGRPADPSGRRARLHLLGRRSVPDHCAPHCVAQAEGQDRLA